MNVRSGVVAAAAGLLVSLSAASAFADAIPPDVSACDGKTAGAACSVTITSSNGVCQSATCSKLDYTHLNDAGTVSYACLQCQASDGGTSGDGGTTQGGGGGCNAAGARAAGTFALALLPLLALRAFGRRKK